MTTFITGYVVVWLAVVLYAARLELRQRRLKAALEALQQRVEQSKNIGQTPSRAA